MNTELASLIARMAHGSPPAVVCIGLTAYDFSWEVNQLPHGGGKIRAQHFRQGGGGMAATAAVTVARLGGHAGFWGRAGDDLVGRAMLDRIAANPVPTSEGTTA